MPKVSVIVPIYNIEKYLRECLDCIINQTLKDIEIILVDDGSTDKSGQICDEYALKDNRIKVIHQENQYVGVARNNGMAIATGEYLICLDSDDLFEPNMLEEMYNRGKELDSDIVLCREYLFTESSIWKCNNMSKYDKVIVQEEGINFSYKDLGDWILMFFPFWPWDKMYKRSFLTKHNIKYSLNRMVAGCEDMVFVDISFALAEKITYMHKFFIKHRLHGASLGVTRNKFAFYYAVLELEKELKQRNLFEKFEKSFINVAMCYLLQHLDISKKEYYNDIYNSMRNDWFKRLNVAKYSKQDFVVPEYYEMYNSINKHPFPKLMDLDMKIKKTIRVLKACI